MNLRIYIPTVRYDKTHNEVVGCLVGYAGGKSLRLKGTIEQYP